jgi:hypothetical protein
MRRFSLPRRRKRNRIAKALENALVRFLAAAWLARRLARGAWLAR